MEQTSGLPTKEAQTDNTCVFFVFTDGVAGVFSSPLLQCDVLVCGRMDQSAVELSSNCIPHQQVDKNNNKYIYMMFISDKKIINI